MFRARHRFGASRAFMQAKSDLPNVRSLWLGTEEAVVGWDSGRLRVWLRRGAGWKTSGLAVKFQEVVRRLRG
jgi:hypothetical protein